MEKLLIEATKTSPYICFDADVDEYIIQGQSFPEDARQVFNPLLQWLEKNLVNLAKPMVVVLKTEYFNSSSNRILLKVLRMFEMHAQTGKNIELHWYYADEDGQNDGLIFKRLLNIPFELIYKGD